MSVRFTAHLAGCTPSPVTVYADTVLPDGPMLRFRERDRVVASLPAGQIRMLFRDADDRVG